MPDLRARLKAETSSSPISTSELRTVRHKTKIRSRSADRTAWWDTFLQDGPIDVSVCIANWNCRELLQRCLESLLDQPQGVRVETIVVDNGSHDGSADMVAREFPEVILERNASNHGFARANNQAAQRAKGRFLLFLNNDTFVPPNSLAKLVHYLENHPEVGMVGPCLRDRQGNAQVSYRLRPTMATLLHRATVLRWTGLFRETYRKYRRQDFNSQTTKPVEVLMGAAVLLPREVFFSCGRWDEDFSFGGEDLALSWRVNQQHKVVYHPQVEITHYGRMSTRQHIGFASLQMAIGFVRYLRKIGCRPTAILFYKTVIIVDHPIQILEKSLQYGWRRFRGRKEKAAKSLLTLRGLTHFVTRGLRSFWNA